MKLPRFSVLVGITAILLAILAYVGYLISNQILYKQQAQPIAFPHNLHAGNRQIACQYCHRGVHNADSAGVPSVQECWECHRAIPELLKDPVKHPEIAKLKQYWDAKKPIQWWKVYQLPDHVRFPHEAHIARGFDCTVCHGQVKDMEVVYPANNPTMGWCVTCHRQNQAPVDCTTCHK
jgi:hypothetical protein